MLYASLQEKHLLFPLHTQLTGAQTVMTHLSQRNNEGVSQRRLVQDLSLHIGLKVLNEIAAW